MLLRLFYSSNSQTSALLAHKKAIPTSEVIQHSSISKYHKRITQRFHNIQRIPTGFKLNNKKINSSSIKRTTFVYKFVSLFADNNKSLGWNTKYVWRIEKLERLHRLTRKARHFIGFQIRIILTQNLSLTGLKYIADVKWSFCSVIKF